MINKIILIGNVGRDPEDKSKNQSRSLSVFSLAVSEWSKKNGESTQWFNIKSFNKSAEYVLNNVKKGNRIYIEGKVKQDEYESADGIKKKSLYVITDNIKILDKNKNQNNDSWPRPIKYDDPWNQSSQSNQSNQSSQADQSGGFIPF